jgi:hypothetical protein
LRGEVLLLRLGEAAMRTPGGGMGDPDRPIMPECASPDK